MNDRSWPRARRRMQLLVACGAALLLGATGCRTWRAAPPTSGPASDPVQYRRARIVLRDSTEIVLRDVVARADSVIGRAGDSARVAIERARVARIETRQVSPGRTLGLAGGVLLAYAMVAIVATIVVLSTWAGASAPGAP